MPKVLLVEDDEMNRDMLSRRLQRKGFDVVIACDGLQSLDMAQGNSPDLILMDMSLPELSGWEAASRIKSNSALCSIPIIALTAHAMESDRQRALDAGCDDYDTKPIDLARLLDKMTKLLAARSSAGVGS
jgi:two-component system, cell cycle response regulator DivK